MSAYQAPSAAAAERMRKRIADAGLTAERRGNIWWVHGPGVDVLVARLENLSATDLRPATEYQPAD